MGAFYTVAQLPVDDAEDFCRWCLEGSAMKAKRWWWLLLPVSIRLPGPVSAECAWQMCWSKKTSSVRWLFWKRHWKFIITGPSRNELSLFIAKRIYRNHDKNQKVSRPAIAIAIAGIAIGLAVMIVSIAVVLGFKHTIQNKVVGFGSHIPGNQLHEPDVVHLFSHCHGRLDDECYQEDAGREACRTLCL